MPIRIVRASTLRGLRTKAAEAEEAAAVYSTEANQWNDRYRKASKLAATETKRADLAERSVEEQGRQLAALRRELNKARDEWEGLHSVVAQADAARDQALEDLAAERAGMSELAAEVRVIRAAVEDRESGRTVRAAIAYGFLHNVVRELRAEGRDLGRLELVAGLLFGDEDQADDHANAEDQAEEVRPS